MSKLMPVHPFPARMAPEVAITQIQTLRRGAVVLDPMMGSGTVLRHAVQAGHRAVGVDMDPLAVLMSRVWSSPVANHALAAGLGVILDTLPEIKPHAVTLPWIDNDPETKAFVSFWFGERQLGDLRRLAYALHQFDQRDTPEQSKVADALRVALSRIIVTKCTGASLAHDVSHSRPHRVMDSSPFEVVGAFERSVKQVMVRLRATPPEADVSAKLGDARVLAGISKDSADLVLTSPPYLNAIDYMRGHKLSLVFLGHTIGELRAIRSASVGAERKASGIVPAEAEVVQNAMVGLEVLQSKHRSMVERYSVDLLQMMKQVARVLKPEGRAILVVGNSCLKDAFIKNSAGVTHAGFAAGLRLMSERLRDLPAANRYLPTPKSNDSALGKRIRTESVLTFEHAA